MFCGGPGETDDHVVPLALGGTDVLKDSSCEECRAHLNKTVDAPILNGMLLLPRMAFNRPRSSKRPPRANGKVRFVPGSVKTGDKMQERTIPTADSPRRMTLLQTVKPYLLDPGAARQPPGGFTITGISMYISPGEPVGRDTEFPEKPGEFLLFLKMIGKIGLAAAYLLRDDLEFEPIIRPLFAPDSALEVLEFVGAGAPLPRTDRLYRLAVREEGRYVVASVQIFSDLGMPNYDVVVGLRKGSAIFR